MILANIFFYITQEYANVGIVIMSRFFYSLAFFLCWLCYSSAKVSQAFKPPTNNEEENEEAKEKHIKAKQSNNKQSCEKSNRRNGIQKQKQTIKQKNSETENETNGASMKSSHCERVCVMANYLLLLLLFWPIDCHGCWFKQFTLVIKW